MREILAEKSNFDSAETRKLASGEKSAASIGEVSAAYGRGLL